MGDSKRWWSGVDCYGSFIANVAKDRISELVMKMDVRHLVTSQKT